MTDYRSKSLWWNTLPEELATSSRYALHSDIDVDIAIVGAGYTGLWTAYYLQQRDPNLNIAIIEAEVLGMAHQVEMAVGVRPTSLLRSTSLDEFMDVIPLERCKMPCMTR